MQFRYRGSRRESAVAQLFSLGILTIMKITRLLLIGACILSGLTGCHKPWDSQPIGATEAAGIKTAALASITANYPDVDLSNVTFKDMGRATSPNDGKTIYVIYILPASAKTNVIYTPKGKRVGVTWQAFTVWMSPRMEVKSVSKRILTR